MYVCPFMSNSQDRVECLQGNCALFESTANQCTFLLMGTSQDYLSRSIEECKADLLPYGSCIRIRRV